MVSVNKLHATDSSHDFPRFPLMNKVDSIYINCPQLAQAHCYESFPPIPNNIWPDKDWAICRDWNYKSTNAKMKTIAVPAGFNSPKAKSIQSPVRQREQKISKNANVPRIKMQ